MTTTQGHYDAGAERERLAADLAAWRTAGYMTTAYARSWRRRVNVLARVLGVRTETVETDLRADADMIQGPHGR